MRVPKNPPCHPLGWPARILLFVAGAGLIVLAFVLIDPIGVNIVSTGSAALALVPFGCVLAGVLAVAAALSPHW